VQRRHPDPLHVDRAQPSQQVQERRVADPLVEAVGRRRAAEMREGCRRRPGLAQLFDEVAGLHGMRLRVQHFDAVARGLTGGHELGQMAAHRQAWRTPPQQPGAGSVHGDAAGAQGEQQVRQIRLGVEPESPGKGRERDNHQTGWRQPLAQPARGHENQAEERKLVHRRRRPPVRAAPGSARESRGPLRRR
jgi:hypothetical protein